MATFFTPKQRYKFALVRTSGNPNVGKNPQILQVLEKYMNRQRIEAKHDLRKYMNNKTYRLVRLTTAQKVTGVPVMF